MRPLFKVVGIVTGGVVLIAALLFVLMFGLWNWSPNERIIVPKEYRGFVCVFYEQPNGTPLKKEAGWLQIEFPATGVIFTSSHLTTGWHKQEFFERDGHRLLPMRSNLAGPIPSGIPLTERIYTGGATFTSSDGIKAAVFYHVGDASDRAKLNWQSSDKWISDAFKTKR